MYAEMTNSANSAPERKKVASYYQHAMASGKNTPIEEEALARMAFYFQAGSETYTDGSALIKQYLKRYPKGEYVPYIKFREGLICLYAGDISAAKKVLKTLERQYPQSPYTRSLSQKINDPGFLNFVNKGNEK